MLALSFRHTKKIAFFGNFVHPHGPIQVLRIAAVGPKLLKPRFSRTTTERLV